MQLGLEYVENVYGNPSKWFYLGLNSTFSFLLNVRQAGNYGITVWTSGTTVAKLGININNNPAGYNVVATPNMGSMDTFHACPL